MAKTDVIEIAGQSWSRTEWNQMLSKARKAGADELRRWPQAKSAQYDLATKRVVLEMTNGVRVEIPVEKLQVVCDATELERADVRPFADGTVLEWPTLDQHFTVAGLLSGVFGTRRWMSQLARNARPRKSLSRSPAAPRQAKTKRLRSASAS